MYYTVQCRAYSHCRLHSVSGGSGGTHVVGVKCLSYACDNVVFFPLLIVPHSQRDMVACEAKGTKTREYFA